MATLSGVRETASAVGVPSACAGAGGMYVGSTSSQFQTEVSEIPTSCGLRTLYVRTLEAVLFLRSRRLGCGTKQREVPSAPPPRDECCKAQTTTGGVCSRVKPRGHNPPHPPPQHGHTGRRSAAPHHATRARSSIGGTRPQVGGNSETCTTDLEELAASCAANSSRLVAFAVRAAPGGGHTG